MNTNATIVHERGVTDYGLFRKGIVNKDRDWHITSANREQANQPARFGRVFHIISSILIVAAALAVFEVTGVFYGIESLAGKIGVIALTAYIYLVAFRRGLYSG